MAAERLPWLSPARLLEGFVASNLGFLVVDILLAHSTNDFAHPAEWIPLIFSALGAAALAPGILARDPRLGSARGVGEAVGWLSVAVGVAGFIWHLEGQFFQQVTLQALVYSAPFVAPLAYVGLGLLLLMNRRIRLEDDPTWGRWVLLLAAGGIAGNLGLSLADHAQNGFFHAAEWIPVVAAGIGVGTVAPALVWPLDDTARRVAWSGLALQVATGLLGFVLHTIPAFTRASSAPLLDRLVFGAPPFAPLLFADLAGLAALGLWVLARWSATATPEEPMEVAAGAA